MPSPGTSRIVVLHLTKYSDHALILHTVDAVAGRCSYLVRGIKRGNAVAAFHPLSLLDIVSSASPKSSLAYLREWEPVRPLHAIRSDRAKSSVAMFLSEVLYRSFTNELSDPQFFDWLCEAVCALETAEGSIANFHLWFLVSYAVQMGFMPAVEISYIRPENQRLIAVSIDGEQSSPSVAQAKRLHELDKEGKLNGDVIDGILSEEKKEDRGVIISTAELSKYFGKEVTPAKMKEQIMALLDEWKEKQPPELAKPDKKKDLEK